MDYSNFVDYKVRNDFYFSFLTLHESKYIDELVDDVLICTFKGACRVLKTNTF